ncbi:adenylate/guanylate cyclase domain-containing protein [Shimia sp.]|uniref:adenylate/guanylate cyclase domain-containing protein n=1 Tax=Shimia sp. TaxID=1954381 RepID=UPI003298B033
MQSRLTIILFVDLVGYSAMMDQDPGLAIDAVRTLKSTHLEPFAQKAGGTILKRMGDGWIIEFPSIAAALDCAMQVQSGLYKHQSLKLRIGCHLGEIIEDDDDFYGAGVNIAQRVQTEAPPGGLMITEDIFRQLPETRHSDFSDAGTFALKNISQPARLFQWRPRPNSVAQLGDVPSIEVHAIGYAPADTETMSVVEDLRSQLISRLSKRKGVSVFDGLAGTADNATYDLRGRLRLEGQLGRLSLTLMLREEGRPVWSENYESSTNNIFEFCDNILELAESDLRLQTNAFDGDRLAGVPDNDLSVSELRARAANEYYKVTYESWARGLALMHRALTLNASDGVSLAMRVEAELMLHTARYETMPSPKVEALMTDLDFAVIQMPRSDYVFWTRGMFRITFLDDIAGAKSDLARSAQVNPTYLETHELRGHIAMREGDFAEADRAFSRIVDRGAGDPLQVYRTFLRAVARFCNQDYQGAVDDATVAADLRPNEVGHYHLASLAYGAMGKMEESQHQDALAKRLDYSPAISTRRPVLPANFAWLAKKLAPLA